MLCALGVVILWIGSVIEVADLSMAVIASLLCVFAVIEYGGAAPWLVYAATSVLSLLLLANKGTALTYVLFFGFYPILKEKLERKPRVTRWFFKELIFHAALVVSLIAWYFLFFSAQLALHPLLIAVGILMLEVVFVLYDVALTRLISFYLFRLRHRFHFK